MSVVVSMAGRLGNNLFQYALGRIVAEELDLALNCIQVPGPARRIVAGHSLDVGTQATLTTMAHFFPNAPLQLPGRTEAAPVESYEFRRGGEWTGQTIDLNSILRNRAPRQIRLRGWFQRYEYYAGHRAKLRRWFRMTPVRNPYRIGARDVLVNIRRGADFGLNCWTLPLSYYTEALSSLSGIGRVFVCGTCIDNNVREALARWRPIYYDAGAMEHFSFVRRFPRIILSNSTFAWWAAFLSDAETIIAPHATHAYAFTGFDEVDLHMREDRYRELTVSESVPLGVLRHNPAVEAVRISRNMLFLDDKPALPVDNNNRTLLEWLAKQRGPISLQDAVACSTQQVFDQIIQDCLGSGFLIIQPTYLDGPT